ncbi:SRPBCC family protein [Microbacterium halophytorum]|uniref:SRPBCC family protein n=1 Tax=Microbacterium halophytorum TaxID=2067568 RepID=UPI000CFA9AC3|nr:SRPBCC domain-containing protein [Microbacterium halophytorum]
MSTAEFTITRTFDAPREAVWRAWTDPALAARWWHPHEVATPPESVSIDLREGGGYAYLMVDPTGGEWPTAGEYLEIREPERLRFTWGSPGDPRGDGVPVITVDLAEREDGRTEMTFRLVGMPDDRGAEHGVHDGWTEAFEELDETLPDLPQRAL